MMRRAGAGRGIRHVSQLAAGTAVAQAAPIVVTPILSRQYSPAQFGEFGVYAAILLGLSLVVSGRYEVAIPLPRLDADALDVLSLSVALSAGVSAILLAIALALPFIVSEPAFERFGLASRIVLLLPPGVFAAAISQSCSYWFTRKGRFSFVARTRAAQGLATAALGIILGAANVSSGLVVSLLAGYVLVGAVFAGALLRDVPVSERHMRLRGLSAVAREYRQFPLLNCPNAMLDAVRDSGTLVVFGSMFGPTFTGYLSQTLRILRAPMSLIGQAVAQVYFPKASKSSAEGRPIDRLTRKTMLGVFGISVPLYLAVFIAGPQLFTLVLGPQWATSGEYARILSPWLALALVASSLSLLPVVRGVQHHALLFNVIETSARFGGLIGGAAVGGAKGAVVGVSIAGFVIGAAQLTWFRLLVLSGTDQRAKSEGVSV